MGEVCPFDVYQSVGFLCPQSLKFFDNLIVHRTGGRPEKQAKSLLKKGGERAEDGSVHNIRQKLVSDVYRIGGALYV